MQHPFTKDAPTEYKRGMTTGPSDVPAIRPGVGQDRTQIYTYFTIPDGETHLVYSAESWVRIRLTLETGGPVSMGTQQSISPVLSGRGILLLVNDEIDFVIANGNRVYMVADTVDRVKFIVEPIPWLQQLILDVGALTGRLAQSIRGRR